VSERWVAAGNPPLLTELQDRKTRMLGPGRTHAETSDYPQVVPADFPPYFSLGARTHLNYLGTGLDTRTEVYFAVFTSGPGSPSPETAAIPFPAPARLDPMIAYMEGIAPPAPLAGDTATIAAGRDAFARERCGTCHHVDDPSMDDVTQYDYSPDGAERFPGDDDSWPRGSIRTSVLHRVLMDGDPDAGAGMAVRADLRAFLIRHRLHVSPSDGYRAAPLSGVGIWVTAPYLHNGSVPTLEDLLRPAAERPATFMRGDFVVDTTLPGNSNQGHEFGTTISDADRTALVAYLRSL
jgi:mono/diheme cytochrome c family protein